MNNLYIYIHRPNETNFITVNYYLVYGVNIMHLYKKVNECLMINNEKKTKMKNMQPLYLHEINLYIDISMTTLHQLTISRSILNLSFNLLEAPKISTCS